MVSPKDFQHRIKVKEIAHPKKKILLITLMSFQQGSKLWPFWSHMPPEFNLRDLKIYLGAFVRVQIIVVVWPAFISLQNLR